MFWNSKKKNKELEMPDFFIQSFGLPSKIIDTENDEFVKLVKEFPKDMYDCAEPYKILDSYIAYVDSIVDKTAFLTNGYLERFSKLTTAIKDFSIANDYINDKNYVAAKQYYTKALKIYPYHSYARLNLGYTYRALGELEESIKIYLEGISYSPRFPLLYTNIARSYTALGKHEKAKEALWIAFNLFKKTDPYCIEQLEKYGELIRLYRDKDAKDPFWITKAEWQETIIDNLNESKSHEDAVNIIYSIIKEGYEHLLSRAWDIFKNKYKLTKNKYDSNDFLIEGFVYRSLGQDEKAKEIWTEALLKFPNNPTILENIAKVSFGKEAIEYIEKSFQNGSISNDDIVLYYEEVEKLHGKPKALELIYNLYKKFNNFKFVNFIAHKKYERGSDEFIQYVSSEIEKIKDPKLKEYELGLQSGFLGEVGRYKEALLILKKLVNDGTKIPGIHWNYALTIFELGHQQEAMDYIENLLKEPWLNFEDKAFLKQNLETLIKRKA